MWRTAPGRAYGVFLGQEGRYLAKKTTVKQTAQTAPAGGVGGVTVCSAVISTIASILGQEGRKARLSYLMPNVKLTGRGTES